MDDEPAGLESDREDLTTTRAGRATRRQVRGSSLLLGGRLFGMALAFGMQVLIVRYLSETDYGAFAYALALVSLAETVVTFGIDRAVTRFVPIYDEHRQYDRVLGTLVLAAGVMLTLGLGVVLVVIGLQGWLAGTVVQDEQAVALLVILIVLAPIHALDNLVMGLFAIFASARAIFVRKYLLKPALRLAVVGLLVLGEQGVDFLAAGYVATGAIAIAIFAPLLFRMMQQRGLIAEFRASGMTIPYREVLSFTVPLLTTDLVYIVLNASDVILLESFHGTGEVAAFRVIEPLAGFNMLVFSSFTLLYTPAAARLFARKDSAGIGDLYWRTAIWVAILSFPIFCVTASLAEPITVLLYEERYRDSAVYLALLSLGYYFNAALGFNGLTLKVFGRLKYVVAINLVAAAMNLGLNILLIPPLGALGAAIGTFTTLIAFNIMKQGGLLLGTGINLFEWRYLRIYVSIVLGACAIFILQPLFRPSLLVGLALVALVAGVVLFVNRRSLDVGGMFPELLRLPLVRRFFGD